MTPLPDIYTLTPETTFENLVDHLVATEDVITVACYPNDDKHVVLLFSENALPTLRGALTKALPERTEPEMDAARSIAERWNPSTAITFATLFEAMAASKVRYVRYGMGHRDCPGKTAFLVVIADQECYRLAQKAALVSLVSMMVADDDTLGQLAKMYTSVTTKPSGLN